MAISEPTSLDLDELHLALRTGIDMEHGNFAPKPIKLAGVDREAIVRRQIEYLKRAGYVLTKAPVERP